MTIRLSSDPLDFNPVDFCDYCALIPEHTDDEINELFVVLFGDNFDWDLDEDFMYD